MRGLENREKSLERSLMREGTVFLPVVGTRIIRGNVCLRIVGEKLRVNVGYRKVDMESHFHTRGILENP